MLTNENSVLDPEADAEKESVVNEPGEITQNNENIVRIDGYADYADYIVEPVAEDNEIGGGSDENNENDPELSALIGSLLAENPTGQVAQLRRVEFEETGVVVVEDAPRSHTDTTENPPLDEANDAPPLTEVRPADDGKGLPPAVEPELFTLVDRVRWSIMLVIFALPVLAVAVVLRLWEFSVQSPYMDETNYIMTGRTLLESGQVYAKAPQWTFGSLLYPLLAGWFDQQGGLVAVRALSLGMTLVTVAATMVITLGFFKSHPASQKEAVGDLALSSKPVAASLLAGLVMAVLPTVIALGRFATYDATAAGFFSLGLAAWVWGWRKSNQAAKTGSQKWGLIVGLFLAAAVCLFLAFLTKYVVAIFLPMLCLLVLGNKATRWRGLTSFVLSLSALVAGFGLFYLNDLSALLQFAGQYHNLKSDDWFSIYIWQRLDLLALAFFAYWGLRQAFRDGRIFPALFLWVGAATIFIFQQVTRSDFDYWKHSIYLIIFLAPLAGWLWSDWTWWEEEGTARAPRLAAWWSKMKRGKVGQSVSRNTQPTLEQTIGGNDLTERPGSYSLLGVVALVLVAVGALFWQGEASRLLSHWPSVAAGASQIEKYTQGAKTALVDDSGPQYYLYRQVGADNVTTPYFNDYKGLKGQTAYEQAVRDEQYDLVVLDGGATVEGQNVYKWVQPLLKSSSAYKLVFALPLGATPNHWLQIYRHLTPAQQKAEAEAEAEAQARAQALAAQPDQNAANNSKPVVASDSTPAPATTPTPAATTDSNATQPTVAVSTTTAATVTAAPAPTATPAVQYPANALFDFAQGDNGWGALPTTGGLQAGTAVGTDTTYQMDGHPSLRFTPQPSSKMYTVGVKYNGPVSKISLYVFVPADKADHAFLAGLYYFDPQWGWHDDGFQNKVQPGRWNQFTFQLPAGQVIQQFGFKLVGYSGSIYINGVTVE